MLLQRVNTQSRGRVRISTNTLRPQNDQEIVSHDDENSDEYVDNPPESALRYFKSQQDRDEQNRVVLVTSEDDINGVYGQPTPSTRPRLEVNRPSMTKSTSSSTRSKEIASRETVQTIRNYSKVNDDGSFTFGKIDFRLTTVSFIQTSSP